MKTRLIVVLLAAAVCALPAEYPELTTWMKGMKTALAAVQAPDAASNPKAVRAAERLGTSYENLIEFWRQQKVEGAVTISETGKTTAMELANALHSGNAEKAAALVKALGANCHSCHEAYREKLPDGRYRIKM